MNRIILTLLIFLAAMSSMAQRVFVVPIETEIDMRAAHNLNKAMEQARDISADLILVRLNTFGGAVDAADSIRTSLMRSTIPTAAFVDVNAASAGALIALACDSVYMAPGASMGSATVVNGAGEPMPQKYQSYMSTIMRATAEHHGRIADGDSTVWRRDPAIAASMVNPQESVSLTARQAVECGYAEGIAADIPAVLADLKMAGAEVSWYESSLTDNILGFLATAGVRSILIMLILGGIYMEMHTPGLGFAAAVATVAAALYFVPMLVAGSMPGWVIICFIAGVVLVALEIFVIPGFGVCGVLGFTALGVALIGSLMNSDAVTGFNARSLRNALVTFFSGVVFASVAVGWLTGKHGPKCFRKHSELMTELTTDKGFIGVDMGPAQFVGQHARAITDMRPAGKIEIDGRVFDAVSTGAFIPAGRDLTVERYENAQLYVRENSKKKNSVNF